MPLLSQAEQQAHTVLQLRATVNVPLVKQDQLVAIPFVHCQGAYAWSADELSLIDETGVN